DHLDQQAVVLRAKQDKKSAVASDNQQSWAERKRVQNRKKMLPKRRDELLEQIDAYERSLRELEAQFGDPAFYQQNTSLQIDALSKEKAHLEAQVSALTQEWEAVEQELEALS